jgi:hypothetical protein
MEKTAPVDLWVRVPGPVGVPRQAGNEQKCKTEAHGGNYVTLFDGGAISERHWCANWILGPGAV